MTDFWIGSDEYPRWWDGRPAHVIRPVPTDGAHGLELMLVEVESTGEQILLARPSGGEAGGPGGRPRVPRPGRLGRPHADRRGGAAVPGRGRAVRAAAGA